MGETIATGIAPLVTAVVVYIFSYLFIYIPYFELAVRSTSLELKYLGLGHQEYAKTRRALLYGVEVATVFSWYLIVLMYLIQFDVFNLANIIVGAITSICIAVSVHRLVRWRIRTILARGALRWRGVGVRSRRDLYSAAVRVARVDLRSAVAAVAFIAGAIVVVGIIIVGGTSQDDPDPFGTVLLIFSAVLLALAFRGVVYLHDVIDPLGRFMHSHLAYIVRSTRGRDTKVTAVLGLSSYPIGPYERFDWSHRPLVASLDLLAMSLRRKYRRLPRRVRGGFELAGERVVESLTARLVAGRDPRREADAAVSALLLNDVAIPVGAIGSGRIAVDGAGRFLRYLPFATGAITAGVAIAKAASDVPQLLP